MPGGEPLRILILEDRAADAELMVAELKRAGFAPEWQRVETAAGFLDGLAAAPEVVLADYSLPQFNGARALSVVLSQAPDIPLILLSGSVSTALAVECMLRGAADYLPKGEMERLGPAVRRALERRQLRAGQAQGAARITQLNRMLYAVQHVHRALVRERDVAALLSATCRILETTEGFGGAWIGRCSQDGLAAVAGDVKLAARMARAATGERHPWGGCPTNRACATGKPVLCSDLAADPACADTFAAVGERGFATAAAVPILHDDVVLGALTIFGTRPAVLDGEVLTLLGDLGADLGRAIHAIEAEGALRESERKYRTFVEGLPVGVYRSSPDGRILAVNRAWLELMGYDSEAQALHLSMAADVFVDAAERPRGGDEVGSERAGMSFETRWKRRDGTPIDVRVTTRPVRDAEGTTVAFESAVEDVTGRRALEEQLRHAQKIEAVGQLAGGIAHDFNNLLTTIVTSVDLLADLAKAGSEAAEDLAAIKHAAGRGAELTRKLLAFGRKQRLELRTMDLNALTRDFAKLARRLVCEDIEIITRLEPGALTVQVDATAVDQILMNLTTNARDAMPGGGVLGIHTGRMTLDEGFCSIHGWGAPGEFAVLSVSDDGAGMDAQTLQHFFEPFFTTKPVGEGTGLGTAMVHGLVLEHHGHIHVESAPGQGTTVKILFPLAHHGEDVPVTAGAQPSQDGTETILLVDDEETLRATARRLLERHGYTVHLASDGADALGVYLAREGEIALIISDVVMPRMSGPDLRAELHRRGKAPRILFTSGYTARDAMQARHLGEGARFIAKPWAAAGFLAAVREALDAEPKSRAGEGGTT